MVSTAEGTMRERNELEGMLHDAAGRLSPAHVAALVAQPEAVRSASAADALTAGDGGAAVGGRDDRGTRLADGRRHGGGPAAIGAGAGRRAGTPADLGGAGGADRAQDPSHGA